MWEPRRLITLWASTACYWDSFAFFYSLLQGLPYLFYECKCIIIIRPNLTYNTKQGFQYGFYTNARHTWPWVPSCSIITMREYLACNHLRLMTTAVKVNLRRVWKNIQNICLGQSKKCRTTNICSDKIGTVYKQGIPEQTNLEEELV
jgi:hypothetical protein